MLLSNNDFLAILGDTYFLVATHSTISRVSLNGQRYQVLVNNLVNAVALDYDYRYDWKIRTLLTKMLLIHLINSSESNLINSPDNE